MSPARTCTAFLLAACLAAPAHAADPTDAARYVPKDANIVVVVKMDQLLASQGFKKLRQEVPNVDKEFEGGFMKEFGFEVSNVERMSMAIIAKQGRPIGVFQLKTAVKPDTVVKAASAPRFDGDKGTMFTQEKVGAMTVYVPNQEFREAFCFVNAKTIVYGKAKELKAVLEANAKPVLSEGLQTALKIGRPESDRNGGGGRESARRRKGAPNSGRRLQGNHRHRQGRQASPLPATVPTYCCAASPCARTPRAPRRSRRRPRRCASLSWSR